MSERNIVDKLFESRRLSEAEFEHNGVAYTANFGRYTADGKSITADEYHKAREKMLSSQKKIDYRKSEDDDLVILANKGDKRAQEEIIVRYEKLVRHIAKGLYMPGGDADDLVQEGLLGLVSAMKDYKPGHNKDFKQFAMLAAKRNMLDAVKSANTQKNSPLNKAEDISNYKKDSKKDSDAPGSRKTSNSDFMRNDPELIYLQKADKKRLTDYMKKNLTPWEMQVLGQYLQGYNYNEIADKLQKNRKSVDNAINSVRTKLRKYKQLYKESTLVENLLESIESCNLEKMKESYNLLFR